MELHFLSSLTSTSLFVPLILFFFFLISFSRLVCKTHTDTSRAQKKLPPGPWKLPIVGNLLQIAGTLPHHALRNLAKKHGPIIHLQLGEVSMIVVSSAQLAKEAYTKQDLALADRPPIQVGKIFFYANTDIGWAPYGKYWRQMRKICTLELFTAAKVQSFHSVREEETQNFIESIRLYSGTPIILGNRISSFQNTIIVRASIGNGSFDQEAFLRIIPEMVDLAGGFDIADLFPSYKLLHFLFGSTSKLQKLHQKLDHILDKIVSDRRKNIREHTDANEDLLDVLLRLKESGGLEIPITFSNIKAIITDMFVGGTDTASLTIEWAMAEMMKNARVMHKAQAVARRVLKGKTNICESDIQDLSYLKLIIKETLRLHIPAPFIIPRYCREQCEVGGYTIPVNTQFIVNAWAIARDPEIWNDPETFEPERFENASFNFNGTNFEYLPFGAGRRVCPGILFGIADIELTLAKLLYHFNWELPNGMKPEDLDMTESFGGNVKMKNSLSVVAIPYTPPL